MRSAAQESGTWMKPLGPDDPKKIGRYELFCLLGEGGMGRVYLGNSPGGRPVAVKVIQPEHARDPDFLARFRSEVAAAKKVSGAYTASVVKAEPDDNPPWLATEFVAGPSLADAVATIGRLPVDAVWQLAAGLVEALQEVHGCDLVHRDLKPGNVLLAANGPKVIDFGISRAVSGPGLTRTGQTRTGQHTGTGTGGGYGTPGFMSPEQFYGYRVGPASDIYALGRVVAYAATGSGAVANSLGLVAPAGLAEIPVELRGLVARCMALRPEDRPTLGQLLDEVVAGRGRYPQASPLSFWREPLASLVRSKEEDLRRHLAVGAGQGHEPGFSSAAGAAPGSTARSHPPTRDGRALSPRAGNDQAGQDIGSVPTQSMGQDRRTTPRPPGRAVRDRPPNGPAGAAGIARGLLGGLFPAYWADARRAGPAGRRLGGIKDAAGYAADAERLFARGRFEEAEDAYLDSLRLDDKSAAVHVDLGRTWYALQRGMDAERAFREAINIDQLLVAAHRNRCLAIDMRTGRLSDATLAREQTEAVCEEVLVIEPDGPAGYANLGDAYSCLARYAEAAQAYQAALALDEGNPRLIVRLEHAWRFRR
jgi:serine/threonine protein kinase